MIGATRASVSKLIGFYEARGVMRRRSRRISILEPEVLRRRVGN